MKICFVSENGHLEKIPRNFENCRTEFAWQIALNADHLPIQYLLSKPTNGISQYDLVIVILPKKLEKFNVTWLLDIVKLLSKNNRDILKEKSLNGINFIKNKHDRFFNTLESLL